MDKSDNRRVEDALKRDPYPSSIRLPRCVIWYIRDYLKHGKTIKGNYTDVFENGIYKLSQEDNETKSEWLDRVSKLYKAKVQSSSD